MSTTVHQALAAVMEELPSIGKGDKAPQGYSYRGIEAITKHLQPLLAKHGVVIVPKAGITNVVPSPSMKEGWQDVYMTVEWTIVGPDGSILTACTTGIGRDNSDKGANKAQTQAFKYLVLHLFCVADGKDDSDAHSYDDHRTAAQNPDDVSARSLGHESYAQQVRRFENLRDATLTLGAEDVKAWVKAQGITKNTFTADQADQWNARLAAEQVEAKLSAAAESDVPETTSGGSPAPPRSAAAEPDPPATPLAGPTRHDATEPPPSAEGGGGTPRVKLGSKATSAEEAAKRALARAGMTEQELS